MSTRNELLDHRATLTVGDRQRRFVVPFDVPPSVGRLEVEMNYGPDTSTVRRNLVTLAIRDPRGLRGAAHRPNADHLVVIEPAYATPGFLCGPLYEGRWECLIDAHEVLNGEDDPCRLQLTVKAEASGPSDRVDADWRDAQPPGRSLQGGPGWYRGDLHSHTVHSDGSETVSAMVAAAERRKMDFFAITDHNTVSQLFDDQACFGQLLPIRGLELTTFHGHANVLGTATSFDWAVADGPAFDDILSSAHDEGAIVVVNHPRALGNPCCTGCRWDVPTSLDRFDAIEVWNGPWGNWEARNPDALELWTRLLDRGVRISAVAGGDAHSVDGLGAAGMPSTVVYCSAPSEASILASVAGGRAYLTAGPDLRSYVTIGSEEIDLLPGSSIGDLAGSPLRTTLTGVEEHSTLWLIVDGVPVERRELSGNHETWLATVPQPERWCRWELRRGENEDGEVLLITNPWYSESFTGEPPVLRPGLSTAPSPKDEHGDRGRHRHHDHRRSDVER